MPKPDTPPAHRTDTDTPPGLYRQIRCESAPTTYRTTTYMGESYLVVPVTAALGDMVVEGIGSDGPEYVPAEVLATLPAQWAGRRLVSLHPDAPVTANTPAFLETMSFGWVFNPTYRDGGLRLEAWVCESQAQRIGYTSVVERIRAAQVIPVSIGAFVRMDDTPGVAPGGSPYVRSWLSVVADHLALLPEGHDGACSMETGCGTLLSARRVAHHHSTSTAATSTKETSPMPSTATASTATTPQAAATPTTATPLAVVTTAEMVNLAQGLTVRDLRTALRAAIAEVEPPHDYLYIPDDGIFIQELAVVYEVETTSPPMSALYERSFSIASTEGGGILVSVGDDRREVQRRVSFTPVPQPQQPAGVRILSTAKSIIRSIVDRSTNDVVHRSSSKETPMCDTPAAPDPSTLTVSALSTKIDTLVETVKQLTTAMTPPPATQSQPIATPASTHPNAAPSAASPDWRSLAPPDVVQRVTQLEAAETAERAALVTALAAHSFTAAELADASLDHLRKLAALAKQPPAAPVAAFDYSGRGTHLAAQPHGLPVEPVPDVWGLNAAATATPVGGTN